MPQKDGAVPRRTAAAPVPTSLGESLESGRGGTISQAGLGECQAIIRALIPRKDGPYSEAVNKSLRELDRMLVSYAYTAHELNLIEAHVTSEAKRWEKERDRRAKYAAWANSHHGARS